MDNLSFYLSYPLFWSGTRIQQFWNDLHQHATDNSNSTDTENPKVEVELRKKGRDDLETDWYLRIDTNIRRYIQITQLIHFKNEQDDLPNLEGTKWGLLKAIKNKSSHRYTGSYNHEEPFKKWDNILNAISSKVNEKLGNADKAVAYWNEKFPDFLLFSYNVGFKIRLKGDYYANFKDIPSTRKDIPSEYSTYIKELLELVETELKTPTELFQHAYESKENSRQVIAFLKIPDHTKIHRDRKKVVLSVDHQQHKLSLQVYKTNNLEVPVHNLKDDLLIKVNIQPIPDKVTTSFAVIMTDEIGSALLEFQELKKNSPISVFVFTDKTFKEIKASVEYFQSRNKTTRLTPKNIIWGDLSIELKNRAELRFYDSKHLDAKIKLQDEFSNNDHPIYGVLKGEVLLSVIHDPDFHIFHPSLPEPPMFYRPRNVQRIQPEPTSNDAVQPEDNWINNLKARDPEQTGPLFLLDEMGSGKVSFLTSIGDILIRDNYIVKYNDFKDILRSPPKHSEAFEPSQIFHALFSTSGKHAASLAHTFWLNKFPKYKLALFIRVADKLLTREQDILTNIIKKLSVNRGFIIIISTRSPYNFMSAAEVWKLDRSQKTQADFLKMYWDQEGILDLKRKQRERLQITEETLRNYEKKLMKIAMECTEEYLENTLMRLPMNWITIAVSYSTYAHQKLDAAETEFVPRQAFELYREVIGKHFSLSIVEHIRNSITDRLPIPPNIDEDSRLFKTLFNIIDLSHQLKAVRHITKRNQVVSRCAFELIKDDDIIKHGLETSDKSVVNYFCAKFAASYMSSEKLLTPSINIIKEILRINGAEFQYPDIVQLLDQVLSGETKTNNHFINHILRKKKGKKWTHSLLITAVKSNLCNLYSAILRGIENAGKVENLWNANPEDGLFERIPMNDLIENLMLSVEKGELIVTRYFVETLKLYRVINAKRELSEDTALHVAVSLQDIDKLKIFYKYLTKFGANTEATNSSNKTPLDILRKRNLAVPK